MMNLGMTDKEDEEILLTATRGYFPVVDSRSPEKGPVTQYADDDTDFWYHNLFILCRPTLVGYHSCNYDIAPDTSIHAKR